VTAYKDQVSEAAASIGAIASGFGLKQGEACGRAAQPIVDWIRWYRSHRPSSSGPELLDGARSAVLEAVAYVTFGLGRASISAIRTQVDLLLGYSYFREHPAEWRRVCQTGEGFKLKSELLKYHKEIQPSFAIKLALIEQASGQSLDEVYGVLSAHIHGQSKHSTPKAQELKELAWSEKRLSEVVEAQRRTAIALSNLLLAVHSREWTELSPALTAPGRKVLTPVQQTQFFA
jgi:hypothetical protein